MFQSLIRLAFRRLVNTKLLSTLLVLSTAITIGMLVCIPTFSGAVGRRLVQEEFGYADASYARPPFTASFYARASARTPMAWGDLQTHQRWLDQMLRQDARLIPAESYLLATSPREYLMAPNTTGDIPQDQRQLANISIMTASSSLGENGSLSEHLTITDGDPFATPSTEALNLWMLESLANELAVEVGDSYYYGDAWGVDADRIPVRIAGLFEPASEQDNLWEADPVWHNDHNLLAEPEGFSRFVSTHYAGHTNYAFWHFVLDDGRVNLDKAEEYGKALQRIAFEVDVRLPGGTMEQSLATRLARGQERKDALSWTLLGISLPLLAIILCFLGAVSSMLSRMQSQETAMLMSRGANVFQVLLIGLVESLVVVIIALPPGTLLGLAMARILGYSAGFLRYVPRDALPVSLASADWGLVVAGMALVVLARLVLSLYASRKSVVEQERQSARATVGDGLMRWLLILLLTLATAYALYRLIEVGSMSVLSAEGEAKADPLLLAAPSLFMLTLPLLWAEIFGWALRPAAWLATLARRVGIYLAMNDLGREGRQYRIAVYMLTLCLAFGVYSASLATSADQWLVDRRQYEIGCDVVLMPETVDERASRMGISVSEARDLGMDTGVIPASEYEAVDGVARAAQVGRYEAAAQVGRLLEPVTLLGVDRTVFPEVGYFRQDYANESLGALMNRLGAAGDGILLPHEFAADHSLDVGSRIQVTIVIDPALPAPSKAKMDFEIVGLYDYFPTMTEPDENPVLVADLNFMQVQSAGLLSHGVWLRLDRGASSEEVLERIPGTMQAPEEKTWVVDELIIRDQSRLERVGILGLLSMCFLTGALLSALGLLVHSATAQQRRALRFAVLQVLGLDKTRLVTAMLLEYSATLLYAILGGWALGVATATLYVPLVHLGGDQGIPIPPYLAILDTPTATILAAALLVLLLAAEAILVGAMLRARLFETLRMGTRE